MARSFLAVGRIVTRPHGGGNPHAALLVEHRVVNVVLARPEHLAVPVRRRLQHHRTRRRRLRIAHRQLDLARHVFHGIQNGEVVVAELERAVDGTVRVDRRIAPIGRDDVVQVGLRIGPVPLSNDDVALDALRPWRRRRDLARRDAIGPVREQRERTLRAELVHPVEHLRSGLSGLYSPLPRRRRRIEVTEPRRQLAGRLVAQLMAGRTTAGLQLPEPLRLALHAFRNPVSGGARAGEFALVRYAEQRKPLGGWIILRRGARVGRGHRRQVQGFPGDRLALRRVHQAVTAHPDGIIRFREIGQQVPATIVGDHDPRELRREVRRFRNHPDSRLGPLRTRHHATHVVLIDTDGVGRALAGARVRPRGRQQRRKSGDRHAGTQHARLLHVCSPRASGR